MSDARKTANEKALKFSMLHEDIGPQLVSWVRGLVKSNNELVPALERLRRSYQILLAGRPVTDAEEILWQVEGALQDAEKATRFFAPHSSSRRDGA